MTRSRPGWLLALNSSLLLIAASANVIHAVAYADGVSEAEMAQELQRAETDPDQQVQFVTQAPPDYVFNFLLRRVPEYSSDASSLRFADPGRAPGVGSERIIVMADGKQLSQRILRYEPVSEYAYFTDMQRSSVEVPLLYSLGHYRFRETESGGTEVRVSVVYQPSSRLFAFLVRSAFNRALKRDLQRAATLIDQTYQAELSQAASTAETQR